MKTAAAITGEPHPDDCAEMASSIAAEILSKRAENGLQIGRLCEGRLGEGKIREKFVTSTMVATADTAVRLLQAAQGQPPLYTEIAALPTPALGRKSNALGFDSNPGVKTRGRVLMLVAGSPDRHVPLNARPFTTGTRDDRSSLRADWDRIDRFEQELEEPVPGTFAEHAQALLSDEAQAKSLVTQAVKERPEVLIEAGIQPTKFLKLYRPKCLIARSADFGTPVRKNESRLDTHYPGDDEDFVEVVRDARKSAVAACDVSVLGPLSAGPEVAREILEGHFGEAPVGIPDSILRKIRHWSPAAQLGIAVGSDVSYLYFPRAQRFVRLFIAVDWDSEAGSSSYGLQVQIWREIGLQKHILAALTLIERAQIDWPVKCLERFVCQSGFGKMRPTKATIRRALGNLSLPPNAGLVAGDRRAAWRD